MIHETIHIFADTLGPTKPNILEPQNNININEPVIIRWEESIDTWAWINEYILLISNNLSFATTLYYQKTPNNEQYIDLNSFPKWNLYLKILAKDEVANISESNTINICNKCDAIPIIDWGNHENTTFIPKPEKEIERITIIENLEEAHQSAQKEEPNIWILGNILYNKELIEAYKYAYNLWITTKSSIYQADLKWNLLRKDLAKMISEYAIKVANIKPNNKLSCNFEDLKNESLETQYYTKLSCKLWLMGRHADGKTKLTNFMPNESVNRAQFWTVLSRTIFGETHNVHSGEYYERYQKHLLALNKKNIMKIINTPWMIEVRWRVMLTMMRADPKYISE